MVSCHDILKRIRAYQFALYDLSLFLDSHPCDQQAMQLRKLYTDKLNKLIDVYEQSYGKLIQTQDDVEDNWKDWISNPWPWDFAEGGN